jgi:hypothetical protein
LIFDFGTEYSANPRPLRLVRTKIPVEKRLRGLRGTERRLLWRRANSYTPAGLVPV